MTNLRCRRTRGRRRRVVAFLGMVAFGGQFPASDNVTAPQPLPGNATPAYPSRAYRANVEGTASFRCTIDKTGNVTAVDILQVPAEEMGFEESVRAAVMSWRFEPARRDGTAIESVFLGKAEFFRQYPYEHARMYKSSSAEV